MKIEIINTGSELLLGKQLNTHHQWLGQELFKLGQQAQRVIMVPDGDAITNALSDSVRRAELVILTGGLGPTSDDITREAAASVTGLELKEDPQVIQIIEDYFSKLGRPMTIENRKQAEVLIGSEVLPNNKGTAPGLFIPAEKNKSGKCAIFLLPGPPRELYAMWTEQVIPRLRKIMGHERVPEMLELAIVGVGESEIQHRIGSKLATIQDLDVGYCAVMGQVIVRLIGNPQALAAGKEVILEELGTHYLSDRGESIEEVVVRLLRERGLTLTTAESCTGGLISSLITDVPGASEAFRQGWVTYAAATKTQELGVDAAILSKHGAVNEIVARQMAEGARSKADADIALSITGLAGPGTGGESVPVGTIFIGIAVRGKDTIVQQKKYLRERREFKQLAARHALDLIRKVLREWDKPKVHN